MGSSDSYQNRAEGALQKLMAIEVASDLQSRVIGSFRHSAFACPCTSQTSALSIHLSFILRQHDLAGLESLPACRTEKKKKKIEKWCSCKSHSHGG